jgi:hypothetical protein
VSSIASSITALRAAGLTPEQILRAIECEQEQRAAARRERNRVNQRNSRSRRQHVSADSADTPSPSFSPPTPSPITTPSPSSASLRSAAPADDGGEVALFSRGKQVLGQSAGGLINQLLAAKDGKVPLARAVIETAATKQSPREWVAAAVKGARDPPERDPRL